MTRAISEINIHCSATRPHWMADKPGSARVAEIKRWHVEDNGWRDIGYHWLIDRDGAVYPGRPEASSGAFEPKVNGRAVGICLIGGFGSEANDSFDRHYTWEQGAALRELIDGIKARHPGIKRVTGHNDYSGKACPGFKVSRWLDGKAASRSFAESGTALGSGAAAVAGTSLAAAELLPLVEHLSDTTAEVRVAVEQAQQADPADPLRWVLLALVVAGAGFALWRRWIDWQRGRQ